MTTTQPTSITPPIQWEWHETARQWDAHHRGWLLMVYRTGTRWTEFTFYFVAQHHDRLTDTRRQIRGEAKSLKIAQAAVIAAVDAAEETKSI